MYNDFTESFFNDTLSASYKTWEEIPVSSLEFNSPTSQKCYVSLERKEAMRALENQSLPNNTYAYEHKGNIRRKKDEEILAVEIDTSNMIDLTNKYDYIEYFRSKIGKTSSPILADAPLERKVVMETDMQILYIVYRIKDNRCVRKIGKAENQNAKVSMQKTDTP